MTDDIYRSRLLALEPSPSNGQRKKRGRSRALRVACVSVVSERTADSATIVRPANSLLHARQT